MTWADAANHQSRRAAFTLVESVMTIAILAVTMATMVTALRYSDNAAMQARLDSLAAMEFAKQCQWLVNTPMSSFRENLINFKGTNSTAITSLTCNATLTSTHSLLPPITSYYLMDGGAFPYKTVLTVTPMPAGSSYENATYFQTEVIFSYSPPTLLNQTPDASLSYVPLKQFDFDFQKR